MANTFRFSDKDFPPDGTKPAWFHGKLTPPEKRRAWLDESDSRQQSNGESNGEPQATAAPNWRDELDAVKRKRPRRKNGAEPSGMNGEAEPRGSPVEGNEVSVAGIDKQVATVEELNRRFALLMATSNASVYIHREDFLPIANEDLKRRLASEVVKTGVDKHGLPTYTSAFKVWSESAKRHIYRRVVFTSEPQPEDTYNLYRGLGVKPAAGDCSLILQHIEEVICSGNKATSSTMLKLLAWQIQNIGKASRIIVLLKTELHQAGKGLFLGEIMIPIYGPTGFVPAAMDQLTGRFNDVLRGRSFLFCDEISFGGDRKQADALKSLSTCSRLGIETKMLPVVLFPVAVNIWMASNRDNAAHIDEHDKRYWVLNVAEHRVDDINYFDAVMKQIKSGGLEAFAHYLLNMDVSTFTPWRDIDKLNDAKRAMIKQSVNPYDVRNWIEACCVTEKLLGHQKFPGTNEMPDWVEDAEYEFAHLFAAYTDWQKTVKSPVAPKPTPANRLGQALTLAGFTHKHTNTGAKRGLPSLENCLSLLWGDTRVTPE